MSKDKPKTGKDEMRTEYDLSKLKGKVRGKYVVRYREDKPNANSIRDIRVIRGKIISR